MLKLSLSKEPAWYDLPMGVRVAAPPLTLAGLRAAEVRAIRAAATMRDAFGLDAAAELDDVQTAAIEGAWTEVFHRALAAKITAWEGILGEDGEPLPVTEESIDAFASHPDLGPAFGSAYRRPVSELVAEGNESKNFGLGATQEAKPTAKRAPAAAQRARAR